MGIGANECGINFGPSAACEALSYTQAILFSSVSELLGILTMGTIVCKNIFILYYYSILMRILLLSLLFFF
jgi:phosphate/sulfate permease